MTKNLSTSLILIQNAPFRLTIEYRTGCRVVNARESLLYLADIIRREESRAMIDSATNAKGTDELGITSVQDKTTEPRILPYYCSWYRSIFARATAKPPVEARENSLFRTAGD